MNLIDIHILRDNTTFAISELLQIKHRVPQIPEGKYLAVNIKLKLILELTEEINEDITG